MKLHDCLTVPTISNRWGDSIDNPTGELYFRDNKASVLAVAHLDSVMETKPHKEGSYVWCPQLDDRLGVWALLYMLPKLDVQIDILLTDCEEIGQSTAAHFHPEKDYNWIVEFDRHGTDLVMYEYETDEYASLMESFGFVMGRGSFSDICQLEHLEVAGFNVGTGYHWEHTEDCWANVNDTRKQCRRFARFWHEYKDTRLPHTPYIYQFDDKYEAFEDNISDNDWWELEDLARTYGYYQDVNGFIQDGGIALLNRK